MNGHELYMISSETGWAGCRGQTCGGLASVFVGAAFRRPGCYRLSAEGSANNQTRGLDEMRRPEGRRYDVRFGRAARMVRGFVEAAFRRAEGLRAIMPDARWRDGVTVCVTFLAIWAGMEGRVMRGGSAECNCRVMMVLRRGNGVW